MKTHRNKTANNKHKTKKYQTQNKIKRRVGGNNDYELLHWIDPNKLVWKSLSANENAVNYIFKDQDKIDWVEFSKNESDDAIDYLEKNKDKIIWTSLAGNKNKNAIKLLKTLFKRKLLSTKSEVKIDKYLIKKNTYPSIFRHPNDPMYYFSENLSKNPNAVELLELVPEIIDWDVFSLNESKDAINLLKKYPEKIQWVDLSKNPFAVDLLKKNPRKIFYMDFLAHNKNVEAIELLDKHIDENPDFFETQVACNLLKNPKAFALIMKNLQKIEHVASLNIIQECLSSNPEAIDFLEKNIKYTDWDILSSNPNAINLLRENKEKINTEELCKNKNPEALQLIEELLNENPNIKLDWVSLSKNPHIFVKSYILK